MSGSCPPLALLVLACVLLLSFDRVGQPCVLFLSFACPAGVLLASFPCFLGVLWSSWLLLSSGRAGQACVVLLPPGVLLLSSWFLSFIFLVSFSSLPGSNQFFSHPLLFITKSIDLHGRCGRHSIGPPTVWLPGNGTCNAPGPKDESLGRVPSKRTSRVWSPFRKGSF